MCDSSPCPADWASPAWSRVPGAGTGGTFGGHVPAVTSCSRSPGSSSKQGWHFGPFQLTFCSPQCAVSSQHRGGRPSPPEPAFPSLHKHFHPCPESLMSYFPFIHMQVAWDCWSWQRDGAGLSLHPSPQPSPCHWFDWSSAGFAVPQCHPQSSVGFVVWGPILRPLHPAGMDPQACFNILLRQAEQELSASPRGHCLVTPGPCHRHWQGVCPCGQVGTPKEQGPHCQDSPTGTKAQIFARLHLLGQTGQLPHPRDRGRNRWCQLCVPPALWVRPALCRKSLWAFQAFPWSGAAQGREPSRAGWSRDEPQWQDKDLETLPHCPQGTETEGLKEWRSPCGPGLVQWEVGSETG